MISELPRLHQAFARVVGCIRLQTEDFRVEEIPAFEPEGHGEHLFIHFEKENLNTPEAVKRIALALNVLPQDCGWAGLKDRRALTTQWASFWGASPDAWKNINLPGIRLLETKPHPRKLRTGQLRGNRFVLRIANARSADFERLPGLLEALKTRGVPNYFGEQRFGREGDNVERALAWLARKGPTPRGRFERKILVSALQSHWFNAYLAERVESQRMEKIEPGELVHEEPRGRLYIAENLEHEQRRVDDWQISPTGPIYGARMRWPKELAEARERTLFERMGGNDELLNRFARIGAGSRRPVRIRPDGLRWQPEKDAFTLEFSLPSGAYATMVMREILEEDAPKDN